MYRKKIVAGIILVIIIVSAGCTRTRETADEIVIAEQFGLAYAPLQIVKAFGKLDNAPDGISIRWVRTSNAAVIREAMAAGRMDIGFMGIPPFLIGADQGMGWKIICGLSRAPLGLVTTSADIISLSDFGKEDRIALPQPGSIQHILLSMQAERSLGSATALDDILVSMNHPDGMNALLSDTEITAHFTSPPYLMMELESPAGRLVVSGDEAFGGPFTFIVGVVSNPSSGRFDTFLAFFLEQIDWACRFIHDNPGKSAEILAEYYEMPEERVLELLAAEGMCYETEVRGLSVFHSFMTGNGYISGTTVPEEHLYTP